MKKSNNPSIRQIKVQTITPAQRLSGIIKSCRQIMRKDKGMNGDADRLPMLTWIMFLKYWTIILYLLKNIYWRPLLLLPTGNQSLK